MLRGLAGGAGLMRRGASNLFNEKKASTRRCGGGMDSEGTSPRL